MLETATGKKLGDRYYVYRYTLPVFESGLSEDVWLPDLEGEVAKYLTNSHTENGDYLANRLPRVCVRLKLFEKCSKEPPKSLGTPEAKLCEFVNKHQSMFFKIEGEPSDALNRKECARFS